MKRYEKLMQLTYPIGDCLLEEDFTREEFNELLDAYGNLQKKIEELAKEAE
jgi:hypothetical protein